MNTTLNAAGAFQLKGGLFTLMVMQILHADENQLRAQLQQTVSQAPNFFQNTPVILDCEKFPHKIDFVQLKSTLLEYSLVAVGIRNLAAEQQPYALAAGLGIISSTSGQPEGKKSKDASTKLVTKPVRSGQQIYAPDGDLIITATVSPGAEILASGNIHIYGSLRGRALAGINGNQKARIFCRHLAAELISIAGVYQLYENINQQANSRGITQVYLQDNQLVVEPIT